MSKRPVAINLRTDSWEEIIYALDILSVMTDSNTRSAKCRRLIKEIERRIAD